MSSRSFLYEIQTLCLSYVRNLETDVLTLQPDLVDHSKILLSTHKFKNQNVKRWNKLTILIRINYDKRYVRKLTNSLIRMINGNMFENLAPIWSSKMSLDPCPRDNVDATLSLLD